MILIQKKIMIFRYLLFLYMYTLASKIQLKFYILRFIYVV